MDTSDADIVQQTTAAVVNISVWQIRAATKPGESPRRIKAYASGFIVDPSGVIVTNKHVIDGAISVTVTLLDGSRLHANLIAASSIMDLALLRVDAGHPLPALKWGNSDTLRVGDAVLTIGNPLGIGMSVSAGIVSALNRDLQDTPVDSYIQTDAAINHGNSGGPLVNRNGEVVGIDTALYNTDPNGGFIGIGFAIAAARAKAVADMLLNPDHPQPGWLGVTLEDVTPELAQALDVPGGFIISAIEPEGPADRAALRTGDVLSGIGGERPRDARAFMWSVALAKVGDKLNLAVWRAGKQLPTSVTVAPWPNDVLGGGIMGGRMAQVMAQKPPDSGMQLAPLTEAARKQYGVGTKVKGVLVSGVEKDCEAADLGVVAGNVITAVQGQPVATPADIDHALAAAQEQHRPYIAMLITGSSGARWISLSVGSVGA